VVAADAFGGLSMLDAPPASPSLPMRNLRAVGHVHLADRCVRMLPLPQEPGGWWGGLREGARFGVRVEGGEKEMGTEERK